MQLTARLRFAALAAVLVCPRVVRAAEVEAAQRVTLFQEPSSASGNAGITVIHPQTDVSATLASTVNLAVGYAVDIVSGANAGWFVDKRGRVDCRVWSGSTSKRLTRCPNAMLPRSSIII